MAATTAALSGSAWELRHGLPARAGGRRAVRPGGGQPAVRGVARPAGRHAAATTTATAGWPATRSARRCCAALPSVLAPGGTASLLANWIIPADGDWAERVGGWVAGTGCDAWIWQREVVDPGDYVTLWLRDAGERPGHGAVGAALRRVAGLVRRDRASPRSGWAWSRCGGPTRDDPRIVCEDVPQAGRAAGRRAHRRLVRPAGAGWPATTTQALLGGAAARAPTASSAPATTCPGADGWTTELAQLRQSGGMRWEVEVDDAVAGLVAACDGAVPLAVPVGVLAAALERRHGRGRRGAAAGGARSGRPRLPRAGGRPVRAVVQRVTQRVGDRRRRAGRRDRHRPAGAGRRHPRRRRRRPPRRWPARCTGCGSCATSAAWPTTRQPAVLVVSQFTLYGDARKGRRPTWAAAAPGAVAEPLVEAVVAELRELGARVQTGRFGADMAVELGQRRAGHRPAGVLSARCWCCAGP